MQGILRELENLGKVFNKDNVDKLLYWFPKLRKYHLKFFTVNGCFDLLTYGHLHILRKTKEFSSLIKYAGLLYKGIVICGLNSDQSIKKLKGESRPILNQEERANAILETGFVDFVYIYDDETSENFIRLFKPDFHINDSSYGEDCIETKVFKEYENEIETKLLLVPKIESVSTSNIVERIIKKYS